MVMHDVIRDFALHHLGSAGQAGAHAALVDAARQATGPDTAARTLSCEGGCSAESGGTEWWRLPETADYGYREYLTYHLQAADLDAELDQVCCDLRFLAIRLERSGPAAVEADLARSSSPVAARLRRTVAQNAHLLSPIEPPGALTTTFTSRLGGIPELAGQMPALQSCLHAWTAWPAWPPPDLPPDALIRIFTGHDSAVGAVAIAPDGTWLATASDDRTARIWAADGTPRATLTGHDSAVRGVAIAPDGTWLATASDDRTARTWAADGTPPRHPHRPQPVERGGDRPGRDLAGHRQHRRDRPDLGRRRHPPRHPHRPRQGGARGGDRPGRDLAGHRQRRPDGPDLGRRRHPPAPPSPATAR